MRRHLLIAVLALLVVSLQHAGLVHPITHIGAPSKETAVTASHAAAECVECALLASGFHAAVPGVALALPPAPPARVVFHSYRSRDADAPAYFESRAPPVV